MMSVSHVLDHVLDYMLDHMIIGLVTTTLQSIISTSRAYQAYNNWIARLFSIGVELIQDYSITKESFF